MLDLKERPRQPIEIRRPTLPYTCTVHWMFEIFVCQPIRLPYAISDAWVLFISYGSCVISSKVPHSTIQHLIATVFNPRFYFVRKHIVGMPADGYVTIFTIRRRSNVVGSVDTLEWAEFCTIKRLRPDIPVTVFPLGYIFPIFSRVTRTGWSC